MKLFKKLFPFLFIVFVWFVFSSPFFLQNKVPFPSTYLVNFFSPWTDYPGFSSPVKNNAMPDVISQIYPWKNFTINTFRELQIPFWNPYSFSGTPHLANYQSAVFSPFNLLFFILPFISAWSILILLQPLLAGFFMYFYLKSLKVSTNAGLLGSTAFMFCGFITTWMAYGTLGYAILFLPLALFSIEKFHETSKNKFLILFSFTFPLSFFSGHFQISIYFLIFVFLYVIFKYYQTKNLKKALCTILFLVFGILLSLPQLLPSIELYSQSLRSSLFQKVEAIPWGYIPTMIAPDFLGNPVTRNDWFGHYAEWNAYIGLIPIFLAFYSVIKSKSKYVWFFLSTSLIAILLSFQTPFLDFLVFLKVPVISTSAASRLIVIFSFSFAVLSALGFDRFFEDLSKKNYKKILVWIFVLVIVFLFLWITVLFKLFIPLDKISIARQNLILPTVILILFLVSILLGFIKNKKIHLIIPFLLIFITAFDLLRFTTKWMPFEPKNLVYPDVSISSQLRKISGPDRIWGNFGSETSVYYNLSSLNGYDAVYIKRYGEFIASLQDGKLNESARSVVNFPVNGLYSSNAINLLGVKYIVNKRSDGENSWNFPYWTYPTGTFPTVYADDYYQVFENKNVYPRTFLVNKYVVEGNPQKILDTMFSSNLNLRNEVVIEEKGEALSLDSTGSAKITSFTPNKIQINTTSNGELLLFLSDAYYPGWKASVDGKPIKVYRADYSFKAAFVPKGNHIVEFYYDSQSFKLGLLGVLIALISMVIAVRMLKFTKT